MHVHVLRSGLGSHNGRLSGEQVWLVSHQPPDEVCVVLHFITWPFRVFRINSLRFGFHTAHTSSSLERGARGCCLRNAVFFWSVVVFSSSYCAYAVWPSQINRFFASSFAVRITATIVVKRRSSRPEFLFANVFALASSFFIWRTIWAPPAHHNLFRVPNTTAATTTTSPADARNSNFERWRWRQYAPIA